MKHKARPIRSGLCIGLEHTASGIAQPPEREGPASRPRPLRRGSLHSPGAANEDWWRRVDLNHRPRAYEWGIERGQRGRKASEYRGFRGRHAAAPPYPKAVKNPSGAGARAGRRRRPQYVLRRTISTAGHRWHLYADRLSPMMAGGPGYEIRRGLVRVTAAGDPPGLCRGQRMGGRGSRPLSFLRVVGAGMRPDDRHDPAGPK